MYNANKQEQEVLDFWKKDNIFQKSVNDRSKENPYVFFDGPPFATGLPHYGHLVASVMKDAVPRYHTMRGKRVERVWGWDCHGLPIENIVEKELGTKSKQEIEDMGVHVFNELCRSKVDGYVEEWKKTIHRFGRWVDMENAYSTMDLNYMESVWWVFKQLWEKDLIYKGYKPMHICPRCETTLSQQEVSEGYKDVKDMSVTAQFRVTGGAFKNTYTDGELYILAWTTTPWTLPGNVLLAVGASLEYSVVRLEGAYYIVAKDLLMANFDGKEFEVVDTCAGADLVGYTYEALFPYFADSENSFRVVAADFVTTDSGTGIVHLAPAFGTDDYEVFKLEHVPFIQHIGMDGTFIDAVTDFAGMHVKPAEDHMATDIEIVKWLAHNGKLFSKQKYEHSYPHCWRCDTPLLNYATSSWFVKVMDLKPRALEHAKAVHWSPEHMKEGRFGQWLEGARDWSISRQRFWATPIPLWESEDGDVICIGSAAELERLSGETVTDLHKHKIDHITIEKDGKTYRRNPDVLDTWFDSGSMPYAQMHYPFEHKEKFEAGFPAEFIAEGQDQTRAWFYYLHMLGTAIMDKPAFSNVIVNGIVLAEDGKKMSKKLKNYPDPNVMLETYGADAMRYYLLSSPVVAAENLAFSETGLREMFSKVVNTLWNVFEFYQMFSSSQNVEVESKTSTHVLDRWILARLFELHRDVTVGMEAYKLHEASRPIMDFISDLSQWYVRRSRDRFKGDDAVDAAFALATLRTVLMELSKLMAPFTPFIAEQIWQVVGDSSASVHLELWGESVGVENDTVLKDMQIVRDIVEMGMSARKESGMKVRQPLGVVALSGVALDVGYTDLITDELNVLEVRIVDDTMTLPGTWVQRETTKLCVALCTDLTDELRSKAMVRELVRAINQIRKEKGYTREDRITVVYSTTSELVQATISESRNELMHSVLADDITVGDAETEVELNREVISLRVTLSS
jgi:isoleucyl-tRNA synthetase